MKKFKFFSMLFAVAMMAIACNPIDPNEVDPDDDGGATGETLFSEELTSSFGTMTTYDVAGDQSWEIDSYGYAKISGYGDSAYNVNEDWMITPDVSLEEVTVAKLTFETVARYFSDLSTETTIWVSEDYVEGDPNNATWTQLECALTDASDWTFAAAPDVDLTPYAGKVIRVAFKYVSTDSKAGTWEVKNVVISNAQAQVEEGGSTDAEGSGTESDPYNVAGAIDNQGDYGWVQGYIVGVYNFDASSKFVFAADTVDTSLLIADETGTPAVYMSVQLPSGAVRDGINLKDFPANLGQKVLLYGSLEAYCGIEGLKSVTYAVIGDVEYGIKPTDTSGAVLNETFATSLGDFTTQSVYGDQVWAWGNYLTYDGYAIISGFANNVSNVNEDWLISPALDLSGRDATVVSFDHTGKLFDAPTSNLTLWVSSDYTSGLPETATWEEVSITNYMTGLDWTFVNSGEITLPASVQGLTNVSIAFKYVSTSDLSGTWEIQNVVVK
ncbi:MAG: choice-of-anchor J domain-containing protein [bacterium]